MEKEAIIKIRRCKETDKSFVRNLLEENMGRYFIKHFGSWDEKKFEEKWKSKRFMIVEKKGTRIGFYDVENKRDTAHIHEFQIVKKEQGKAIGRKIMGYIEEDLPEEIKTITLHVFKDNYHAFKFYRKLGYKASGLAHRGSSYIMKKTFEK